MKIGIFESVISTFYMKEKGIYGIINTFYITKLENFVSDVFIVSERSESNNNLHG